MVSKYKEKIKQRKKADKEWSIKVKTRFNNKCAFCDAIKYIQAHHIIPREIKEFRHDPDNGIALCPGHHKWLVDFSAHRNPLGFFIMFEKKYPKEYKKIRLKYVKFKSL